MGFEGMKKEVMAMQNARAQSTDERKEDMPFRRWSVVCIACVWSPTRSRNVI